MPNYSNTLSRFAFRQIVLLALSICAIVLVFWQGLSGEFFFDDQPNILDVEGVRLANLELSTIHQALASGTTGVLGRPISQLSFAINYYFSGYNPFAFKITNLFIHCLNSVLIYLVVLKLTEETQLIGKKEDTSLLSGVIALFWAVHPIQITPVLYVVQRMTSLSALFLLAAFLLHITARQSAIVGRKQMLLLGVAWALLWPLSILSKESGVLLVPFVVAYELIIRRYSHQGLDSIGRGVSYLALAAIVVLPFSFFSHFAQSLLSGYDHRPFTLIERLLTEGRVIWSYVAWIVIPHMASFTLFHDDIQISSGIFAPPTTALAVVGLLGLLWIAWKALEKAPLVSFGIVWFLIGHSLESTFLPLEIAHEHRNYLPVLGILLPAVVCSAHFMKTASELRTLGIALCCAFVGYCGFVTALRANMFGNEGLRTQMETQFHPASPRSNYEAGRFLSRSSGTDAGNSISLALARKHYELATSLDPSYKMGLLGEIDIDCQIQGHPDKQVLTEFENRLKSTAFSPGDSTLMFYLQEMTTSGKLCLDRADIDRLFSAAFQNSRVSSNVQMLLHSWYADYLWLHERDMDAARSALHYALTLSPSNPSNRLKMAQLLYISGEHDQALQLLLALSGERFQPEEQKTLADLLSALQPTRQGK